MDLITLRRRRTRDSTPRLCTDSSDPNQRSRGQQPVNVFMQRCGFELVALLYRLRSKVHCRKIHEAELKASGCFE